jgi:hypothetical protein
VVDSNLKGSKVLNEKTVKYEIAKAPEIWHVARPKIKYFGKELFSKYLYIERGKKALKFAQKQFATGFPFMKKKY